MKWEALTFITTPANYVEFFKDENTEFRIGDETIAASRAWLMCSYPAKFNTKNEKIEFRVKK